jgi:hypothetical protein
VELAHQPPVPNTHARATAEDWVTDLTHDIAQIELGLVKLGGLFDEGLPQAVVGSLSILAGELRERLPALRQAARDVGEGS